MTRLLAILLYVSATWTNPDGSQGQSEAWGSVEIRERVYFYSGRQSRIDWQFAGKRQRVLVWTGGSYITVTGTNVGPGMVEIDGVVRRYDESGWVK